MRDGMRIGRTRTAIVVALVALAAATFFHAPDDEVFAADNEVAAFYRDGVLVVSVPDKALDSSGVGEVALQIVDPTDKAVASRTVASHTGGGRWKATIPVGKALPLE